MKKYKNFIISILVSLICCMVYVPIKAHGTLSSKTFYGYTFIYNLITKKDMCESCNYYNISYTTLVIEFICIFIVSFILLKIIDKRRKK